MSTTASSKWENWERTPFITRTSPRTASHFFSSPPNAPPNAHNSSRGALTVARWRTCSCCQSSTRRAM
eukprot:9760970-Lingulodinium_polyedra.AAC.1